MGLANLLGTQLYLLSISVEFHNLNKRQTMAKSQDAKKTVKKEPLKTPKEKKEEKRAKKANKR